MVPILVRSAVLAGAVLLPSTASAQARLAGSAPPAAQRADSVAVLRQARSAQSAFEHFRFRHLPIGQSLGGSQRCDARVGRFCFWLDDEDERDPPPEPRRVAPRRAQLLAVLDHAAAALPGDGWIAGQRVRYLAEAGEADRAVAAARACRADPWWCSALEGYALHDAGRYADAEAAFVRALEAMPAAERAEWTDLQRLLPADGGRTWKRAGEGERQALARRVWWLADPLWSEPGNDRWTEHGARWVFHRLQDRARTTENFPWGDDSGELLVRYGRHVWWERYIRGASTSSSGVISYIRPFTREFLPPVSAAVDPSTLEGTAWEDDGEPDATRYAPPYARRFVPLPHDFAVFRRGAAAELVAAYAMEHDSLPARPRVRAALVTMADADAPAMVARATGDSPSGALRLRLAPGRTVASLEVREETSRIVARWREALALAPGEHASDLLLLSDAQARPATLDEAAPLARGSRTVAPGETLAVYWELYDLPPGTDTLGVALQLVPGRPGWGRRQLEAVGLARAGRAVSMRWNEEAEGGPIVGRSLGVRLPPELRPGEYTLEVEVRVPGRAPVVIRRPLAVARPRDQRGR